MTTLRLVGIGVLAILSAGCASDGIFGAAQTWTYAAATGACGPTDGPAVAIYLAPTPVDSLEPSPPYVRINILQPPERLTERAWVIGGSEPDGSAAYYSSASEYEIATSGRVRVRSVASDGTVTGVADLSFPTSGHLHREFQAAWTARYWMCG